MLYAFGIRSCVMIRDELLPFYHFTILPVNLKHGKSSTLVMMYFNLYEAREKEKSS